MIEKSLAVSGLIWVLASATAATAAEPSCAHQEVADRQGVGAFNSILDGQPPAPDQPQLQLIGAYDGGAQVLVASASLGVTPGRSGFLCAAQFTLVSPSLFVGGGNVSTDDAFSLVWEQRWLAAQGSMPTFSTNVQWNVALDGAPDAIEATAILAWSLRPGVVYINVSTDWSRVTGLAPATVLIGLKRDLSDQASYYLDMIAFDDGVTLEASLESDLSNGWSIGPGLALTFADDVAPDIVIGVALSRGF